MAGGIVLFRPLPFQQRFGDTVTPLLFQISENGVASMMPYHRTGTKAKCPAFLLQTPAKIDIVAGRAKNRIESSHGFQAILSDGHVTARDVLGDLIRQ